MKVLPSSSLDRETEQADDVKFESKKKSFPSMVHLEVGASTNTPSKALFSSMVHDGLRPLGERGEPDYGNVNRYTTEGFEHPLPPYRQDESMLARQKKTQLNRMGKPLAESYYRFDERSYPRDCFQPAWTDHQFPTCNAFHEMMIETSEPDWDVEYLSYGAFRDIVPFFFRRKIPGMNSFGNEFD